MGYGAHPILSGSMEPAIHTGSVAIIKSVPVKELKKGDVIAFKNSDQKIGIAHRIKNLEPTKDGHYTIITKGDANNAEDPRPYKTKGNEIGKVFFSIPKLGYIALFLQSRSGIYIMSGILGLIVVLILWPSSNARKKENETVIENELGAKR